MVRDDNSDRLATRLFGPGIRRLSIVVGLPLLDGVFVTLVLAGILDSISGILLTGIVIFGGTAAAAVIIADCDGNPRAHLVGVIVLGMVIIPMAAIQAMLAPTVATWLDIALLERFAAIVLAIIAIDMMGLRINRYLPSPGPVVVLGILVSLDPANGIGLVADTTLLVNGAIAAGIGIGAVMLWLLVGQRLRSKLDPDRIRVAGGVSLAVLAVALLSPVPAAAAIGALVLGILFAIDPQAVDGTPIKPHVG